MRESCTRVRASLGGRLSELALRAVERAAGQASGFVYVAFRDQCGYLDQSVTATPEVQDATKRDLACRCRSGGCGLRWRQQQGFYGADGGKRGGDVEGSRRDPDDSRRRAFAEHTGHAARGGAPSPGPGRARRGGTS